MSRQSKFGSAIGGSDRLPGFQSTMEFQRHPLKEIVWYGSAFVKKMLPAES